MSVATLQEYEELRDLRHMEARAAGDLDDWLAYLRASTKSDRTVYSYERTVAALLRAHSDKPIEGFTATDINSVLLRFPDRSRYIARSILNSFFTWAENSDVLVLGDDGNVTGSRPRLERNPMTRGVPKMRAPYRRPKSIYTDEERGKLQTLPEPDGALFTLLFACGLRRGEARGLTRGSISLDLEELYVYNGKGNKNREVGLPPSALAAVADLDMLYGLAPDEYPWSLTRAKKNRSRSWLTRPISDTSFQDWYERAVEAAGVRYLNPHQTRHTYGWLLREQGLDIEERKELMGHESIATTQRYYGRLELRDFKHKIRELRI